MKYATWRGNKVKVLEHTVVRAVIVTPLAIRLRVHASELTEARVDRPKKDSRKF